MEMNDFCPIQIAAINGIMSKQIIVNLKEENYVYYIGKNKHPLELAVLHRRDKFFKWYLHHSSIKNAQTLFGNCLALAIDVSLFEIIKYLIETCHVDPKLRLDDNHMPICKIIFRKNIVILEYLLKHQHGIFCEQFLYHIVNADWLEGLQKIISHYSPEQLADGMNAAVQYQRKQTTEWFISFGFTNILTSKGWSSIYVAAEFGHLEILKQIYPLWNRILCHDRSVVNLAAQGGQLHNIIWLIEDRKEIFDKQAIEVAIEFGHMHIVKYLETHGFDLNQMMKYAVRHNQITIVKYLSQYITTKVIHPKTIWLHRAIQYDYDDVAKYLYKFISVEDRSKSGHCALNIAVQYSRHALARWLIHICHSLITDHYLKIASEKGDVEMLIIFLRANAKWSRLLLHSESSSLGILHYASQKVMHKIFPTHLTKTLNGIIFEYILVEEFFTK
jgi:ankyrin repeat protein